MINETTITIIEKFHSKENGVISHIERTIYEDGELIYAETTRPGHNSGSELQRFIGWLFRQENRSNGNQVGQNGCKCFSFFRKRLLQLFYLKAKFFYGLRRNNISHNKTA